MTGWRRRLLVGLAALFVVVAGCKKKEDEPCESASDCEGNLICAEWTDGHERTLGDCPAKRCCTTDEKNDEVARRAACDHLIGVVEAAHQPATHELKVPRELEQLAIVVRSHIPTFQALKLSDPELAGIRGDYIEMSEELADAAKQRAFFVNRFDGPNVFAQIDRMKAVANREAAVVEKLRARCKGGDRPRPAFGGRSD